MVWLFLTAGLVLLIAGAEFLVKGSSKLAAKIGISPLVIGLVIAAYGTSSPELAVSIKASFSGQPDIAMGNVVGSNIFNVLFILGISALIMPLSVSAQLIRIDVPIMIVVSLITWVFALNGAISRQEGMILFMGMVAYTCFAIYLGKKETKNANKEFKTEYGIENSAKKSGLWKEILFILGGLITLVIGARWLVDSAVEIAKAAGISESVIGLTIVAAGTSLPEVATSVIASIKGERDIAVGNVVGSSIFNILAILGISSLISPSGLVVNQGLIDFDIPIMIAVAFACLPIFFTGQIIHRWEGGLFLVYYIAYTAYLCLHAVDHDALPWFSFGFNFIVFPLSILTLILLTRMDLKKQRA